MSETAPAATRKTVRIVADYRKFNLPIDFRSSVERLLLGTPPKYLVGLDSVILRDSGGFTSREKKHKKKDSTKTLVGCYYRATRTTPPRIHLFLDNIVQGPSLWLRIPLVRELMLAGPLFHELGHHIQEHIAPEYKDRETTADAWSQRLARDYFSSRRTLLLLRILRGFLRLVRRARRKTQREDS